tara:strand:+ start:1352 stop:1459 length:108 start_codon:yes stop_codon:yes gene_type:complete
MKILIALGDVVRKNIICSAKKTRTFAGLFYVSGPD